MNFQSNPVVVKTACGHCDRQRCEVSSSEFPSPSEPHSSKSRPAPEGGIANYPISWKVWALWFAAFAIYNAFIPRDAGFDVAHYHIHNGWSAFEGRLQRDMAPVDLHSFLNPVHNALLWGLINRLPGPIAMAVISPVQAALLPLTYLLGVRLAQRLGVVLDKRVILSAAFIGFLALPNQLMFASLANDHWGAVTFIAALVLVIGRDNRPPSPVVLIVSSLALGMVAGMKLTNLVYIVGFAVFVLGLAGSWRIRLKSALLCAIAGLTGLLLTGGIWAWQMWELFGNPIFPNLGGAFPGAPLGPDESFRDERFLPTNWLNLLVRPFSFSLNGALIYEFESADPRFLLLYLGTLAAMVFSVVSYARRSVWPNQSRLVLSLSAGVFVSFLVWSATFSIIRYALAYWVMAPIVGLVLLGWMRPSLTQASHWTLAVIAACVVLFVATGPSQVRRVAWSSWTEPYVWVELPEQVDIDGSIVVLATQYPTGFVAPSLSDAAWLTHADSPPWSRSALANYRPIAQEKIMASRAPVYVVMFWGMDSDGEDLIRTAAELGLRAQVDRCQRLRTAFDIKTNDDDMHWVICPATRSNSE